VRQVVKVQTLDGNLHDSEDAAYRHAEKRYGDALLRLARELTNQKYSFVSEFIDSHVDDFVALKTLKEDMTRPEQESER
jgi:hypothetical protein